MKLRTYQAYTMAEALAAVKRELGADAVILNTRTFRRTSMLGLVRKTIVEVTATPAEEARPRRALQTTERSLMRERRGAPNHVSAQRAYGDARSTARSSDNGGSNGLMPVTAEDRERTRQLAVAMQARFERERMAPPNGAAPATRGAEQADTKPPQVTAAQPDQKPRETSGESESRRFVLVAPGDPEPNTQATTGALDTELAAIKGMVSQVLQRQSATGGRRTPNLPAELFDQYLHLIGQDISEELADQIVGAVRDKLSPDELADPARVRGAMAEQLAQLIPASEDALPTESPDGRPLTIALVGPTGVGKTTTLAKLAATFKLKHNKRVGLITADTYRIAAVDQLRTYANIIGLPLQVALTPSEMRQAANQLSHCEVILVDTAGRSQNDELRLDELRRFIEACDAHEVHLVLSSTASEKVLLREAEAFSAVGVHKIVLTKLDEAVSFGMLVNVIRTVGKELSFITTGQEVPHHIEPGRPRRLAELILGGTLHE